MCSTIWFHFFFCFFCWFQFVVLIIFFVCFLTIVQFSIILLHFFVLRKYYFFRYEYCFFYLHFKTTVLIFFIFKLLVVNTDMHAPNYIPSIWKKPTANSVGCGTDHKDGAIVLWRENNTGTWGDALYFRPENPKPVLLLRCWSPAPPSDALHALGSSW